MFKRDKQPYPCRGKVWMIPTAEILPDPGQPRRDFPLPALMELAQSISENGILQPLTVMFRAEGPVLIAGERRLRAARIVGLREVPCVEVQADERQRCVLSLIENLQRQDLNCFEVAQGIARLIRDHELTQCEAAQQLGWSPSAVANKLRLLRLPSVVREKIVAAGLSERHARALLRLEDPAQRDAALERMIGEKLTVAQSERLVDGLLAGHARRRPAKPLVRDVRVFFNTIDHALGIMRRGGISAEAQRRDDGDVIEYIVRIPKGAAYAAQRRAPSSAAAESAGPAASGA